MAQQIHTADEPLKAPGASAWEVEGRADAMSEPELRRQVAAGQIDPQTPVRPSGSAGWRPAVAALARQTGAVWLALVEGRRSGPFTVEELRDRLAAGEWSLETLVWRPGLAAWGPLRQHAELTATLPPAALAPDPEAARRAELERLVRRAPDAEVRQAALVELGRLALAGDDPEQAAARFRQALAARPDDEAAFLGLEEVLRGQRAWTTLFDLYRQRARATSGADRGRVMERLGALAAGPLGRPDRAIAAYQKALELGGERPEPLRQLLGLLADGDQPAAAGEIALRLARVEPDAQARARARRRAAELLAVTQPARAARLLQPLVDAHPEDLALQLWRWRLLEAAGEAQAHESAAILLARLPADHPERVAVATAEARRQAAAGADAEALRLWGEVLAADPEHAEARAALSARIEGSDAQARLTALSHLEEAERLPALRALAAELEAEAPTAAIPAWQALLALRPHDAHAQARLDALLAESADHEARVALLVERLDQTRGDARRLALYQEIAALFERQLATPEGALAALVDAFKETFADEVLGAWLGRLGRRLRRLAELVAVYEAVLERFEAGAPVGHLHRRVGGWLAELGELSQARGHFEAALALDAADEAAMDGLVLLAAAGDLVAARRAVPALEARADWSRLHAVRRRLAGAEAAGPARAAALVALADLCVARLGRAEEAAAWLGEALVETPADGRILDRLLALLVHLPVADVFDDALSRAIEAAQPTDQVRLGRALARHRAAGGDPAGAAAAWRAVQAAQPDDPEALEALDTLLGPDAEPSELAAILTGRLALARGPTRIELARRLAALAARLGSREARVEVLWVALDAAPELAGARRALIAALTAEGDWPGIHAALEPATGFGDPPARAAAHAELAELCAGPLDRPAEAVDHWRAVMDLVGESDGALSALRALYQRLDAPAAEAAVLARLATRCTTASAAAGFHADRARVLEGALGDLAGAALAWEAALAAEPGHPEAPWALHRLWQRGGPPERHGAVLSALIDRLEPSDARRLELLRERGRLRMGPLADAAGAAADFEAVRTTAPQDGEALRRLEQLYGAAGERAALAEILVERAAAAEAGEAIALRLRVARLDPGAVGEAALRRILAAEPTHEAAFQGLAARLEADGRWPALVTLLEERARRLPAEAPALIDRAATLALERLGDPGRALELWLERLPAQPDDEALAQRLEAAARAAHAFPRLVAAADAVADALPVADGLRLRIAGWVALGIEDGPGAVARLATLLDGPAGAAALAQLEALAQAGVAPAAERAAPRLRAQEAWIRLYGVLSAAERALPSAARVSALLELATLASEAVRRPQDAWGWLRAAFLEDPADDRVRDTLEAHAARTEGLPALAEAYAAALAGDPPPDLLRRLAHRAADLAAGRLQRPDEALALWGRILDTVDPADRASLEGTGRLLKASGRFEVWARRLDAAGAAEGLTDARRVPLWVEAGEAWTEAGHPREAIARLEAVVAEVPDHARALALLEGLRAAAGDQAGLLEVLTRRAPQAPRDLELRLRAARLATELDRSEEAIGWWLAALDLGASERDALAALQGLYARTERFAELAEICERRRSLARDEASIVALDRRLGALYAERLDRPADALAAWESVLRRRPGDLPALWAARVACARLGDLGGRAQVERRLLELLPADDAGRAELWAAVATTCEQLEQPADAAAAWAEVLALEPTDPTADARLEALARARGDWAAVADRLEARAQRARGEPACEAWLAVAALAEPGRGPLADPTRARQALARAVAARPTDSALLERLAAAHGAAGAYGEQVACLDARAALASGPERARWLRAAAEIRAHRLGRIREALAQACQALPLDLSAAALDGLEALSAAAEDWGFAAEAVRACLAEADLADPIAAGVNARLIAWAAGPLDAPAEALARCQARLAVAPEDAAAHAQAGALLERLGDLDGLARWLAAPAPAEDAPAARARQQRLAGLHERQRQDAPAALRVWRGLLDADPGDGAALAEVERLSAQLDDWAGLAELCRAHAERLADPAARAARFKRLGDLYAGPLDLPAAALGAYREALAADPSHGPAGAAFEAFCLQSGQLEALNAWYASRAGAPVARPPAARRDAVPAATGGRAPSAPPPLPVEAARPISLPPEDLAAADAALTPAPVLQDRASRALEAAYRGEGRFSELAALYRRRLAVTREPAERTTLEGALLDLYLGPADDPARAAALLLERLPRERHPRFLLEQIVSLQGRAHDWTGQAGSLRTLAELADLPLPERLKAFDALARLHRDHLGEPKRARAWWQAALEFDGEYAPAIEGLRGLLGASAPALGPRLAPPSGPLAEALDAARLPSPADLAAPGAEPLDPGAVKRYRVRRAGSTKRRRILGGLAVFGLFWALVATGAFIIQSLRLDRTTDEMQTANRAYTRLAKEVTTTQARFTEVAQALNQQHGEGTPLELFAADPVELPDAEAAALTDRILGIAINDIKMRGAVDAMRELVGGVVAQREIAVAQAEDLKGRLDGVQAQLASLEGKQHVADELLAQRLDESIEQLETALDITGLDSEGLLAPDLDALAARAGDPTAALQAAGGPWAASTVTYASPLPGMTEVMSGFGDRGQEHHNGIDIPAPLGTPVRSVADGEVIFVQDRKTWESRGKYIERDGKRVKSPSWRAGVYVEIRHVDGRVSRYLHLDDVAYGIEPGVRVRKRQVIGSLGRTAVEHSQTHLHFELREPSDNPKRRWGDPVDPEAPLINPDPNRVAQGVEALKARNDQLSRLVTAGVPFVDPGQGLEGDDEAPKDPKDSPDPKAPAAQLDGDAVALKGNATAQVLGSLGLEGRVGRLQRLEQVLRAMPLVAPVDDFKLSSGFGKRRDPLNPDQTGMHTGIDIPGAERSPVRATAPGTVIFSGWKGGFGRTVEIDHGHGIVTRYGHLYKSLVREGQAVTLREQIGQMGSSGRSTGTHLHYEVQVEGEPVDPLRFLKAGRAVFDKP